LTLKKEKEEEEINQQPEEESTNQQPEEEYKNSDTVFSIRVTLVNRNGVDTKNEDIKISAATEIEAFNKLKNEVDKIHNGAWFYAGYFKKGE